jgi:malate dehydrogenase (oxaloacetate-decarboxylating)
MQEIDQASLELHEKLRGKLATVPKRHVGGPKDLALLYTPGVAAPCRAIARDPGLVYSYTGKGNLVAVVSDGSAVLGLGNIGPEAGLPVMEGKALLFKDFAGIDAFPLVLATQDSDEIVRVVRALAPSFGGINLEDIAAPRCFAIEKALQESLSIPVFHDDQHGTAIVVLAGLMNAAQFIEKPLKELRVVVNGAGAAGTAISKMLLSAGLTDVVVCDRAGVLLAGDTALNPAMAELAELTNPRRLSGNLETALRGADVFIGVSAPRLLNPAWIKTMGPAPVIFALANPDPEILPDEARSAGAKVVATGRSDLPNQINNVLAFPGIFRGALDVRATEVNQAMKLAAAQAIAGLVPVQERQRGIIVPPPFHPSLAFAVALSVAEAAIKSGVALESLSRPDLIRKIQTMLSRTGFSRGKTDENMEATMNHYQEKIGEGLVRIGVLSASQCDEVLALQNSGDKRLFGEIALAKGYLDFDTLIHYLQTSSEREL